MSNTVEVFINGHENVSGAVAKAIAALEALKDQKFDIDIDVDTDKADKAIKGLKDDVDGLSKNKVDLTVDTDKARKKITYLQEKKDKLAKQTQIGLDAGPANSKLDRLHEKKNKFATDATKIELDAGPANSKLDRLFEKRNKFASEPVKVEVDTSSAQSKLKELGDETKNIKIDIDSDGLTEDIEDIAMALDGLEDKTINIDVDAAQAFAQIRALEAALNGANDKRVTLDVDVDDTQLMLWKSELAALNRDKRRVENSIEGIEIPANIVLDENRIRELEDRIAERRKELRIKAGFDDSEIQNAEGLKDKTIKVEAQVSGLAEVASLKAMIDSLSDKTVNVRVNSDSNEVDRLTNSRNGVARPITQTINVDVNERELEEANRLIRRKLAARNARGQSFLDAEIRAAKFNVDNLRRAGKNIKIRLDDEGELARLQKNFDKVTIKIAAAMDRDQLLKDLKNNKKVLEDIPVKVRTQDDNNALRNINKDIKNIQKIKKISIPIETRLQEADKISKDIDRIFDTRDAAFRGTKIKADADTAAAEAKLATLTRPRSAQIQADADRSALAGVTRLFSNAGNSIRRSFGGDNNNRRGSLFGDIIREGKLVGSALGSVGRTVNSGIAAVTRGIPVLGGVARAAASIKSPILSAGVAFAALGSIGVLAGGAAAGGIYLVNAALGAVAGVAGLAGAAIGGLFIGGFAAIAAQSEQVSTAFSNMGTYVSDAMKVIAQPVEMPLVRAASALQGAFDQMRPSLDRIAVGTGNLIDNLSGKLPAIAGALGPTLEKAFGAGSRHLQTFGNALPSIITGLGKFFDKLGGEGAIAGAQRFYEKLPGIFSAIGTGIDKAGAAFVKVDDFINSGRIDPLKSGIGSFVDDLANADYSGAITGITNLANSFGEFAGSINVQGVADFVGDTADTLATVTDGFTNAGKTVGDFFTILKAGSKDTSLDQGMRSLIDITDGINGALGGDPNFIKDQIASPDAVDIPFDVNLLPTYNVVGPNGEPALEIPENLFPESETVSTNVGATVDITAIPGAIESDGIASVIESGVFDDIASLPPQDAVVKIKALFEMINDGEIQGQFTDEILKGADAGNLPPIETEIAMEAIAQLAVTGVVPPQDLFNSLDSLNLNLPPQQLEQAIDLIYKLGERGLLTPEQVSGLLGSDGLNLQPIEAEQAVNIKLTLAEAMGIDQGGQDMDTFLNRITSRLSNTNGGPIEITKEALLSIDADPNKALAQIKALIGTIRGVPADKVEINVPADVTLTPNLNPGSTIAEFGDNGIRDAIQGIVGENNSEAVNIQQNVLLDLQIGLNASGVDNIGEKIRGLVDSSNGGPVEISQELVATLDATLGNPADLDAALDSLFSAIAGKPVDVTIPANYEVEGEVPEINPEIPPVTTPAYITVYPTLTNGLDMDFSQIAEALVQGGDKLEIDKELYVKLKAQLAPGGTDAEVQAAIAKFLSAYTQTQVDPAEIDFPVKLNAKAELGEATGLDGAALDGLLKSIEGDGPVEVTKELLLTIITNIGGMEGLSAAEIEAKIEGLLSGLGLGPVDLTIPLNIKPEAKFDGENFLASFGGAGAAGGKGVGIPLYFIPPTMPSLITPPAVGIPSYVLPPTIGVMPALPAVPWPTVVEPPVVPPVTLPPLRQKLEVEMGPLPKLPDTRSVHHVDVTSDGLPSFPNTTSGHHVNVTSDGLPSFPNTTSTHTIRVAVVGGSAASPESARSIAGSPQAASLARGIAPLSMGAVQPMGAGISSGGRGVQAIRQTGVDIANNFADGLASGVGAVEKSANELAQAAGQIGPQVDKYLSANSPEYNEAKRIGGEVVSSISQGITNAQGEIGKAMDGVNKFISDPLGEIDKALSANIPGYDVAKQQAQSFAKGVEDTMSGLGEAAKVGSDGFQKIIAEEFVLPPMDQLIAKAQEVGDGIGAALMGDPSKLAGTMDGIGQAISSKIGTVTTKVGAVMDQVNQTMRDKVPGFADAQDKAIEFGNGLAAGVENARLQMNQQLTTMGLPTIPTPQMAMEGINAEVVKAKTAIDQGFALLAPPTIPAPQMAAEGLTAGIQKIKSDIDAGLSLLKIDAPAPVIPAPDLGPVKQALSTIPGAIETVNKVESDIQKAKTNLDSIPEQVTTENTVEGNIKAVLAQLATLAGMNTTSTHTVNVVQQGAGIPKGGAAPKGSAFGSALGVGPMGGINGASMGRAMGVSGSVMPRGTAGLGIAVGALAFGGLLLGLGALFAGLFAILGAFSNNLGKLKPGDIDGGSYRPDGVINHYYYQTTQNNHFDGGLIGDPEIQGKRVLEVLESTPNGRRFRNQQGAST